MLATEYNTVEFRGLLSAVDKMREILHENKSITLPEIVVVGDQSVGKSSVLESICGIQLPRAQDTCTRCPLELRMKVSTDKEYATIRGRDNKEDTVLKDLSKVAEAVEIFTEKIAGKGKNISKIPIILTVYKRAIPYDLTLIDLPGIIRYDSPKEVNDNYEQIVALIKKYIKPSTAIILHVIPSYTDFNTSETMRFAKEFDPQCQRQLIAVSKIDKFDKGIGEKLQGGTGGIQLHLGCVAVRNRTPEELQENISFDEMKQRETLFFLKHPEEFEQLPDDFKGSGQLVKRLAHIQQERIQSEFPQFIKQLKTQLRLEQDELEKIPPALITEMECLGKYQTMIDALRSSIHSKVNGDYHLKIELTMIESTNIRNSGEEVELQDQVCSGTNKNQSNLDIIDDNRIAFQIYRLQKQFAKDLASEKTFSNFFSDEYQTLVRKYMDDAAGTFLPNFPNHQIVKQLYDRELERLPSLCSEFIQRLHKYISEVLLRLLNEIFSGDFPRLITRLKEIIRNLIDEAKNQCRARVLEILEIEKRIFTLNHYYMDTVNNTKKRKYSELTTKGQLTTVPTTLFIPPWSKPTNTTASSESVTNEAQAAFDIQAALHAYCKVVEKRLTDIIPQTCYHLYITQCAMVVDRKLTSAFTLSDLIRTMRESPELTNQRDKLTRNIQACKEALRIGTEQLF